MARAGPKSSSIAVDLAADVGSIPITRSIHFSELALLTMSAGSHGTLVGHLARALEIAGLVAD